MITETKILTDQQISDWMKTVGSYNISGYTLNGSHQFNEFARAIEQAVLQSPEIQARMEAYAAAKVREALEAAAQACEARIGQHAPGMTPEDVEDCDEEARLCAAAIRALIPPLPGPVEPSKEST